MHMEYNQYPTDPFTMLVPLKAVDRRFLTKYNFHRFSDHETGKFLQDRIVAYGI